MDSLLGGDILALKLNIGFTDAGLVAGTAPLTYKNLRVCGLTATPTYNGMTLDQLLGELNTALGGGFAAYTYDDLNTLASDVSVAFEGGAASLFAQGHLFSAPCP